MPQDDEEDEDLATPLIEGCYLTREGQHQTYTYIAIGIILVAVTLVIITYRVAHDNLIQQQIINTTEHWLSENKRD